MNLLYQRSSESLTDIALQLTTKHIAGKPVPLSAMMVDMGLAESEGKASVMKSVNGPLAQALRMRGWTGPAKRAYGGTTRHCFIPPTRVEQPVEAQAPEDVPMSQCLRCHQRHYPVADLAQPWRSAYCGSCIEDGEPSSIPRELPDGSVVEIPNVVWQGGHDHDPATCARCVERARDLSALAAARDGQRPLPGMPGVQPYH